jgi:hypothetical protein
MRQWHAFGYELVSGNWALVVAGPTEASAEEAGQTVAAELDEALRGTMTYLASFDHDPTNAEREALAPPGHARGFK